MDWAPLNVFQRLVREWENLHPYNGVQLLRRAGAPPDADTLQSTWQAALARLGLGPFRVDGAKFQVGKPDPADSTSTSPVLRHTGPLEPLLTAEINHPYTDAEFPLRPFVVTEGDTYCLGIAYRHWVADSVAIRRVLREWHAALFSPQQMSAKPLRWRADGYWKLFGPSDTAGGLTWSLARGLIFGAAHSSRGKRVQRIERRTTDFTGAVDLRTLPAGTATRVHRWAKARGYRVNDILLAALTEALTAHELLTRTTRRQDMALGTIVDLRSSSREDLSNTFSLYLGFTTVFLRPRHFQDFHTAAARIAKAHAATRENHVAPASLLRMAAALVTHRYLGDPAEIAEFYRKRVPLSGGTSNVLLRETWLTSPDILDYIRVSPTGPMMPVVLAATTLGDRLHLTLTRRTAVVPAAIADAVLTSIAARLSSL